MKSWPFKIDRWSPQQIAEAVKNDEWQAFRRSLKGQTTENKLIWLRARYAGIREKYARVPWEEKCRIDNYINALKRGGQLTVEGAVQR